MHPDLVTKRRGGSAWRTASTEDPLSPAEDIEYARDDRSNVILLPDWHLLSSVHGRKRRSTFVTNNNSNRRDAASVAKVQPRERVRDRCASTTLTSVAFIYRSTCFNQEWRARCLRRYRAVRRSSNRCRQCKLYVEHRRLNRSPFTSYFEVRVGRGKDVRCHEEGSGHERSRENGGPQGMRCLGTDTAPGGNSTRSMHTTLQNSSPVILHHTAVREAEMRIVQPYHQI